MPANEQHLGLVKQFGARYGRRLREKVAELAHESRRRHTCPYCSRTAVKRQAVGLWHCRKCEKTFTGKAYTIPKKIVITEEVGKTERSMLIERVPVEPAEPEEESA